MFSDLVRVLDEINGRFSEFGRFSVDVDFVNVRDVDLRSYIALRDDVIGDGFEDLALTGEDYVVRDFDFNVEVPKSVFAIDSSSLKVLETDDGLVVAYRVCVVAYDGDSSSYSVYCLGPYLCYLSEWNRVDVYNMARRLMNLPLVDVRSTPGLIKLVDRVRNAFERVVQKLVLENVFDSLILWDGSLTMGTIDTPISFMRGCMDIAFRHNNVVVGVSKRSWLRTRGGFRIVSLLSKINRPCFIDIHDHIDSSHPICGRVYVAKFDVNGPSLRVDVAVKPGIDPSKILSMIAFGIPMFNGYPEPLRLAHAYCYFTNVELLNLEAYALSRIESDYIEFTDWRNLILYPY